MDGRAIFATHVIVGTSKAGVSMENGEGKTEKIECVFISLSFFSPVARELEFSPLVEEEGACETIVGGRMEALANVWISLPTAIQLRDMLDRAIEEILKEREGK